MSTSFQQVPVSTTPVERRFYPRVAPNTPIFFAFDACEESLLLNISENGLLVSTPAELTRNSVARLSISLNGLPKPVTVSVRVVWTCEARKLAGIQLLNLCEHDRERIRKWGARESIQSCQPERNHSSVDVAPDTASFETAHDMQSFMEEPPSSGLGSMVPLAPPPIVRTRSTSIAERRMIWGLYLASASLVAVFFLRNEALGSFLSHSLANRSQASSVLPLAQKALPSPESPDITKRAALSQPASPAPAVASTKSKIYPPGAAAFGASKKAAKVATDENSAEIAIASQTQSDEAPSDQSHTVAIPDVTDSGPAEMSSVSPDPPALKKPLPNPTRPSDVPGATSPTIPASSSSNPIVEPARPAPLPASDTAVIQMDPRHNQTLEVRLPNGRPASFFNLPGELVLESPTMVVHIQRSVLMPAARGGWFSNRNKKVVVGELISRADPQATQVPTSSGNSVRVTATVGKDGRIENVKLILGPANLAQAVAQALHQWRYQPTLVDDKPVETQCIVVFQFHAPALRTAKR